MGIRLGDGYHSWVPAPDLTVECLPRSLLLQWTLPEWLPSRVVKEFKIYRGATASGTGAPTTLYATIDEGQTVNNPAWWRFVDTDVAPDTVYCYRVTFTHVDACAAEVIYESPFSDPKLNLRGAAPTNSGCCATGPPQTPPIIDGHFQSPPDTNRDVFRLGNG